MLAAVGEFTRVCTYDRPNTTLGDDIKSERNGKISTPVAQPHPLEADVDDLHALLNAAGETGPPVLVAHSYGGLIGALYASRYPDEVVGRVNADVTNVFLRETLTPADYQALIEAPATPPEPGGEALELGDAIELVSQASPALPMPAVVLGADKPPTGVPALAESQRLLASSLCAQYIARTNAGMTCTSSSRNSSSMQRAWSSRPCATVARPCPATACPRSRTPRQPARVRPEPLRDSMRGTAPPTWPPP